MKMKEIGPRGARVPSAPLYLSIFLAIDHLPFRQFTDISCIHLSPSVVPYGQINAGGFVRYFHRSHIMAVLRCIWFTCLI